MYGGEKSKHSTARHSTKLHSEAERTAHRTFNGDSSTLTLPVTTSSISLRMASRASQKRSSSGLSSDSVGSTIRVPEREGEGESVRGGSDEGGRVRRRK